MYPSSGLSTDVFAKKTNINTDNTGEILKGVQ